MKGIGLVFAGGGGKGAYEIGVWKYLHEIGLEKYVRVVLGTSVGALNAALFVGNNYELAEKLRLNINQDKILTPKRILPDDIMKWFVNNGLNMIEPLAMGFSKIVSGTITSVGEIAHMFLKNVINVLKWYLVMLII